MYILVTVIALLFHLFRLFDVHARAFRTKSVEFSGESQDGNISMAV